MSRDIIRKKLLELIKNMELEEDIADDVILHSDYVANEVFSSITFVMLVVLIEDEFKMKIDEENLLVENLKNFDTIVDLIERLMDKPNDVERSLS